MSDIVNLNDVRNQFMVLKEKKELQEFNIQQQQLIEALRTELEFTKTKLLQVETLLMQNTKTINMPISPEEVICIEQIGLLKAKSTSRELNLDEIKRLDLLVKNLKLIRKEATSVIDTPNLNQVTEEDLVAIARGEESEPK